MRHLARIMKGNEANVLIAIATNGGLKNLKGTFALVVLVIGPKDLAADSKRSELVVYSASLDCNSCCYEFQKQVVRARRKQAWKQ